MDAGFNLDPAFISIIVGTGLPLLVGVVTKKVASSGLKACLLALFSAATGILTSAQNSGGFISKEAVFYAGLSWVLGVASYYGFYKPTGVGEAVATKTENFGVGSAPPPPERPLRAVRKK